MIGEIRDNETAQIAVQAASTGHLVLSTLHTNSASEVVSRLASMGVTNDDVANTGNLFMAQRLVRRVCQKCKEMAPPTAEEKLLIEKVREVMPEEERNQISMDALILPHANGCTECGGTGYSGQMVIAETLLITKEIAALIAHGALISEIEEKAIELGMITMAQDGILSVIEGDTTLEEVKRVTDI